MSEQVRRWELTLEGENGEVIVLEEEFVGTNDEAFKRAELLAEKYDANCICTIHLNSLGKVK